MPKISQIAIDQAVDKGDKLLGSDAGGGTRNYRVEDISKFIKDTNAAGVVGQYPYIYYNSAFGGNSSRPSGSITIDTPNDTYAFADVTTIKFSNKTFGSDNVIDEALLALDGKTVAISSNSNQNNFGIYTCGGVSQDPVETDFYNVSLTAVSTNGNLTDGEFYSVLNSVVVETAVGDGGLTEKNFTTALKNKLEGIEEGAEVNVQSDWDATSGDALILNKPTIPTNNNQLTNGAGYITGVDWDEISGSQSDINISGFTNDAGYITDGNTNWNNTYGFITGLDWTELGGSQSSINLSGFNNDSGFITSYTETDTLDSVTGRGNTTTNAINTGLITSTTTSAGNMFVANGTNSTSLVMSNDSSGRVFINVSGSQVGGGTYTGGAYFVATGYQEAWFEMFVNSSIANNRRWRMGHQGTGGFPNKFIIQKLNDAGTSTLNALAIDSTTGNIGINTTTDAGYKLDVNGTGRFTNTLALGSNLTFGANNVTINSTKKFGKLSIYGSASAVSAIAIGYISTASNNSSVSIGYNSQNSGDRAVTIGADTSSSAANSVTIGRGSVGATNSFVSGSNLGTITDVYFGSGVRHSSANTAGVEYRINGSGASNSFNIAGGNIVIAGGKGTGTGTPGDVIFATSSLLGSSKTLQSLTNRVWVKGDSGNVGIGTTTPSYKLQVNGTVSAQLTNATQSDQVYYNSATGELTYGSLPVVSTPTLGEVTTAGNVTTNTIEVGKINTGDSVTVSNSSRALNLVSSDAVMRILRVSPNINTAAPAVELIHRTTPDGVDTAYWDFYVLSSGFFIRNRAPSDTNVLMASSSNNVLIGTTTDAGYKLEVNGITRTQGLLSLGTGTDSTSIGLNASATQTNNIAIGTGAIATGTENIVIGAGTDVYRQNVIAIGTGKQIYALNSVVIGKNAGAYNGTVSIGENAFANFLAVAIGRNAYADQERSTSLGDTAYSRRDSVSVGYNSRTTFTDVAVGSGSQAVSANNVVIGTGSYAGGQAVAIGRSSYAKVYTTAVGWSSGAGSTGQDNLFLGYNSGSSSTNSDWLIIGNRNNPSLIEGNFATGNVMIGTSTDNGYKLDVNGNTRVSGNLIVDTNTLYVDATNDRVGIGKTPSQKLDVNGNIYTSSGNIGLHRYGGNGGGTLFLVGFDNNHAMWNGFYGDDPSTASGNNTFDGIYWRTYRGIRIKGGWMGAVNLITAENSGGSTSDHVVKLYASGGEKLSTSTTGVTITGNATADSFIKTGGTASEFLKADGSVDSNTYLTSYTETQTLDDVTTLGNSTTNDILVNKLKTNTGSYNSSLYLTGEGGFHSAMFKFNEQGRFIAGQVNVKGTNDVFFQAAPYNSSGYGFLETWSGAGMVIGTGGNANPVIFQINRAEKMRLATSTGNVLIGTTTDAGYKLDVNGTVNANDFSAGGSAGYTGTVTIQQPSPLPPITIDIQGGIITNVT